MYPPAPRGEPKSRFTCPIAPSANGLFATASGNGPGSRQRRLRAAEYKRWQHDAGWLIKAQYPAAVAGRVLVLIAAPLHRRRDVDNAIKATLDLIAKLGLIDDDRWIDDLRIVRTTAGPDMTISIWPIE